MKVRIYQLIKIHHSIFSLVKTTGGYWILFRYCKVLIHSSNYMHRCYGALPGPYQRPLRRWCRQGRHHRTSCWSDPGEGVSGGGGGVVVMRVLWWCWGYGGGGGEGDRKTRFVEIIVYKVWWSLCRQGGKQLFYINHLSLIMLVFHLIYTYQEPLSNYNSFLLGANCC